MPSFLNDAYLDLDDSTFVGREPFETEEITATVSFHLRCTHLDVIALIHDAAPEKRAESAWCRVDPITLPFADLKWQSLSQTRELSEHARASLWTVDQLLYQNRDAIRSYVERGARELASKLQNRITTDWRKLDRLIGMRENAMRMTRGISPVTGSQDRLIDVELRGFDDLPVSSTSALDEIVCNAVDTVHLETMSDDSTWIGITLIDGRRLSVNISASEQVITAEIDEGPLGELAAKSQAI